MLRARVALLALLSTVVALAAAGAAEARDPGRWLLTGASHVPIRYWQGLTADPGARNVFFVGIFDGLWRTTPRLRETAGVAPAIPSSVRAVEGYNHIGDLSFDRAEGGRLLLPLECFNPITGGNPCGTGAIGVADPATLAFRYYVKLDPAEIPKAMWAEVSPSGARIWTSSGDDLLAYRAADVTAANAGPSGGVIRAVRRLPGAVPPSGITGAVFRRGRLLVAGSVGDRHQIWSIDTATGRRRLEIERTFVGESEGLHLMRILGGELHYLNAPFDPAGRPPTFAPQSALLHFVRARGRPRLRVTVLDVRRAGTRTGVTVKVTRRCPPRRPAFTGAVRRCAIAGAWVNFAGARGRTGRRGRVRLTVTLALPGRYRALARRGGRRGLSRFVSAGPEAAAARPARPRSGAG